MRTLISISLVFLSLAGCFGPNEMNPICWIPEPYAESSRLLKGQALLRPLQDALDSHYLRIGSYPRDLTSLAFPKGSRVQISRYYQNSTREYHLCDTASRESTCSTIRYQRDERISQFTHHDSECLKRQERQNVEYRKWWQKTEQCAASKGVNVTAKGLSDRKAEEICPERYSKSILQRERPSGFPVSNPDDECNDYYSAYSLQVGLDVFCSPHLATVFHQPGRDDEWRLRYITGK